ncbi:phytoene desaturase family protein [Actimicrobium antarcticum]|uniref:phytoene desaturase family protein n=1 Tax=Actimicrobium antarcticum TaxID=1051899 RepID=UPI0031D1036A
METNSLEADFRPDSNDTEKNLAAANTAIVIGAGFGGLASAIRLAARGIRTTVVDRLDIPGGRAAEFTRHTAGKTFRYDAGPTVLTAPILFEELFTLLGERLGDHVELMPVKPWYQMQFVDGSHLDYGGSTEQIQAEIAKFSTADAAAYPAYLAHSKKLFEKGYEELGTQPFLNWRAMARALPAMARLRADRSVYAVTARYFKHEHIRRAFSIQPLLVGGNPFDTTSIYSLIHYLERKWGVWFVRGGMARLVDALVALATRHGVQFVWNAEVAAIEVENGLASGVRLRDGRTFAADNIVCNADPGYVLTRLLPDGHRKVDAIKKKQYSMSLFVWYFSTDITYPDVAHHTILFGATYREVLRKIFDTLELPEDLSIYLHRPSATDPACAPPGHDAFYALVPVPNLRSDIDWTTVADTFKAALQATLEQRTLPGLGQHIVDEFHVTPEYFSKELLSPWGAGFSITPTLMQSAGFRFPNRSATIPNLYFAGAGTHPGAGVPGVVTSAKVVERLMFGSVQ